MLADFLRGRNARRTILLLLFLVIFCLNRGFPGFQGQPPSLFFLVGPRLRLNDFETLDLEIVGNETLDLKIVGNKKTNDSRHD